MSVKSKRIDSLAHQIRRLRQAELRAETPWQRWGNWLLRWGLMLWYEFVRDDGKIRAESLAFLMVFSLLPLIAGGFFIFNVLAQFGMVQDAVQNMVNRFLGTIPDEHRQFVQEYILRFTDAYFHTLSERSGSIGIFAIFILGWVGLSTFNNIDRTLNHIWSSDKERPFLEKVRNFLVTVVAAPVVMTAALSIPLMVQKTGPFRYLVERIPLVAVLMNAVVMPLMLFGVFAFIYRYVPVRRVRWRSALGGAALATVLLQLVNEGMRLYFRFGTYSAYGKAAIVPLVVFWIFILWMVFILGAELSFLMQCEKEILREKDQDPSLREGGALVSVLLELLSAHREGKGPLTFERLQDAAGMDSPSTQFLVDYLLKRQFIVPCAVAEGNEGTCYVLARDIGPLIVAGILRQFFERAWTHKDPHFEKRWTESLESWLAPLESTTFEACLANGRRGKK